MQTLEKLLVNAFAKFLAADLSIGRARLGLFGIWVANKDDKPTPVSDTQLERSIASRDAWSKCLNAFPNPYEDLVVFYKTGASLGRWENNVLDVFGPNNTQVAGIPMQSLIDAANNSIHRICAKD